MVFTAEQVRKLREKTGAGILDCKNALVECNGDMDGAIFYLQKKGLTDAQKRSGRSTDIGRVIIANNDRRAVIIELLCETDFVARNETFIKLGKEVAAVFIDPTNKSEQESQAEELIKQGISVIKENIQLKRHMTIPLAENQFVNSYIHGDEGGLGAVVVASVGDAQSIDSEMLGVLLHDIAMHICAYRPHYLSEDEVPADYREQQIKIFTEQAKDSDKPENVLEKIVAGKLRKHFSEICLLEQGFVKEEKKQIRSVLLEATKKLKQEVKVTQFICYKAGEQE